MSITEQNEDVRYKYKNTIQYEQVLGKGVYGVPIVTSAFDIAARGIGFYSQEELELDSLIRITCDVSNHLKISFIARIIRLEIYKSGHMKYIVAAEIINIDENHRMKFNQFINSINLYSLLDKFNLEFVTDFHIICDQPLVLKQKGVLKRMGDALDEFTVKNLLINVLTEDQYEKFMRDKDINFILPYNEKRLRGNIHWQQGRVEGVFRIVRAGVPEPSQLGLPPVVQTLVEKNKKGLILIAGRTGSGKTTTLSSLVHCLSKMSDKVIISIEDPIEYVHEASSSIVKQRELGRDTISYASAIKNTLRQNPDVLIIGEILDGEIMELVLSAAESGVLVLSTMHASNTYQVFDRITSFFPIEAQKHILNRLSIIIKGIIIQELYPQAIGENGLVPSVEIFLQTDNGKKLIRDGDWKQIPDYLLMGKRLGMQTMKDSVQQLVTKGVLDISYLKEYSDDSLTRRVVTNNK